MVFGGSYVSGEFEGCNLGLICIEEDDSCLSDNDCSSLCGDSICNIQDGQEIGQCETVELIGCEDAECSAGDKEFAKCKDGRKIVTAVCSNTLGKMMGTGLECDEVEDSRLECAKCGNGCVSADELPVLLCLETTEEFECVEDNNVCLKVGVEEVEGEIEVRGELEGVEEYGDECQVKSDCGDDWVCDYGYCNQVVFSEEIEEDFGDKFDEYLEERIRESDVDEFDEGFDNVNQGTFDRGVMMWGGEM